MEIRHLRYFTTVAHMLNFSRAAENLHITQPTLSHQIAEMEDELGGELFFRTKRMVKLTDLGKALLPEAENLLYQFDITIEEIKRMSNTTSDSQSLTIGIDTFDDQLERVGAIGAINEVRREMPRSTILIKTVPFRSLEVAFKRKEIDVGLYSIPKGHEAEIPENYKILREDRIVMAIPKAWRQEHPDMSWQEIAEMQKLYLVDGDQRWNEYFIKAIKSASKKAGFQYLDSFQSILNQVEIGYGYLLNSEGIWKYQQKDTLVEIPIDPAFGSLETAIYREENQNELLRQFLAKL